MKILFIARAGSNGFKSVVQNQYDSLLDSSISLRAFPIQGNGLKAYFKAYFPLIRQLRKLNPDVIHAHYSFSGALAILASRKIPVVVSLMGSDVEARKIWLNIIRFFSCHFWSATIVKSDILQAKLKMNNLSVLPNGVDINRFVVLDKLQAQTKIGWDSGKRHILFLADPQRKEKNVSLFQEAIAILNDSNLNMQIIAKVDSSEVPIYLNAADVVVLSSLREGSPNVIKEAMACNRPIVSTKVGDVEDLLREVEGAFLTDFDPVDFADKIMQALEFQNSNGRNKIIEMELSSEEVANKLISIYSNVLSKD